MKAKIYASLRRNLVVLLLALQLWGVSPETTDDITTTADAVTTEDVAEMCIHRMGKKYHPEYHPIMKARKACYEVCDGRMEMWRARCYEEGKRDLRKFHRCQTREEHHREQCKAERCRKEFACPEPEMVCFGDSTSADRDDFDTCNDNDDCDSRVCAREVCLPNKQDIGGFCDKKGDDGTCEDDDDDCKNDLVCIQGKCAASDRKDGDTCSANEHCDSRVSC